MRTIPRRELRNNSSRILDAVKNGESFEITNHGEIVALLIPPAPTPLERLIAAGKVERATASTDARFADIPLAIVDRDPLEVLDEMRGE